jgi:hypothetical protein
MARFDPSMLGFVFEGMSEQFEKRLASEGEAILAAHLASEQEEESRARVLKGGASFTEGDLPKTPAGRKFREQADKRFKRMSGTGAAAGLTGEDLVPLPEIKEAKPTGVDLGGRRIIKKLAKEQAIKAGMSIGYTREEAEELYNRGRARSDRPTG